MDLPPRLVSMKLWSAKRSPCREGLAATRSLPPLDGGRPDGEAPREGLPRPRLLRAPRPLRHLSTRAASLLGAAALLALVTTGCTTLLGANDNYHQRAADAGGAGGAGGADRAGPASATSTGSSTSGAGGGGGAGGAPEGANTLLVDDMEDGAVSFNVAIPLDPAATGTWAVMSDSMTTTLTSPPPGMPPSALIQILPTPRSKSHRAVHLAGHDPTHDVTVNLRLGQSPWDVSGFKGIKFWARTDTPACPYKIMVGDTNTTSTAVCTKCYDHFTKPIAYLSDWKQYTVDFTTLRQAGWGVPQEPSVETKGLTVLIFGALANCAFDMWIDDIILYR